MSPLSFLSQRTSWPIAGRLAFFYIAIFLVVGVHMPFWPAWLRGRGLDASEIGVLLSVSTWVKVFAGPMIAQSADRHGVRRPVMVALALCALFSMALYAVADGFWGLFGVAVLVGFTFPPLMPFGESTTMVVARARGLDYGRIRLWGSLAFVVAAWGGGRWLGGRSDDLILWMMLGAMVLVVLACVQMPVPALPRAAVGPAPVRRLLSQPTFLLFLLATSLIQGSHAVYYGFSTLHWRAAGLSDSTIGLLWAEGVIAEIALFAFSGLVIKRLGVVPLLALAAGVGMARWGATAASTALPILVIAQLGHAFTFGATHLAAMHFIHEAVPPAVAATAQSLYSAIAMGVVLAATMIAAGALYQAYAGAAFFAMAVLSALGLGAVMALRRHWNGAQLPL